MITFRFLEFKVYKDSKTLYKEIVSVTKKFPRECWELGDQLKRSLLSICLNIAEGSGKASDKEFNRYLNNALGSVNEAAACFDILHELGLISTNMKDSYMIKTKQIADQLGGFSKKLKS